MPSSSHLQTGMYQSFPKGYYKSVLVKKYQIYKSAKLAVKKNLKNDVGAFPRLNLYCSKSLLSGRHPARCKIWGLTILKPLGLQGQKLTF